MAVEINIPEDSVLISRTDTKGVITYASPDFLSISGYEDDELLKKPHNIIRHPDMPSQVFKEMWSTIKSGHVWTGIVKNRSKNGDYYWVDATVTPIKEANQITGYVSVRKKPSRRDITRAESLYATIRNSGKKNFFDRLFDKPSLQISRLSLSLLGVFSISIFLNAIGFFFYLTSGYSFIRLRLSVFLFRYWQLAKSFQNLISRRLLLFWENFLAENLA